MHIGWIIVLIIIAAAITWRWSAESMDARQYVNKTRTVTLHYTKWCGACKLMKPVWDKVKLSTANYGIIFKEVDEDIAKTPGITGYPTIRMVTATGAMVQYSGPPQYNSLRNWIISPMTRWS